VWTMYYAAEDTGYEGTPQDYADLNDDDDDDDDDDELLPEAATIWLEDEDDLEYW